MAINNDPTRGTGPDKDTVASGPGLEAGPTDQSTENTAGNAADPARGGCMKFGWGCLPVLGAVSLLLPAAFFG